MAEPPFSVEVETPEGAVPVIRVAGELDFLTSPRLRAALLDVFTNHPGDCIVDLSATAFMDSIGMSVLIQAAQRLRASNGTLEVRPSAEVRKVLDVAGVSPLFRYNAS
ncbi:MAG: STAS domain-containing protein [Actinobacteria bacterium]|nr:STAS domain-containing protein [Actinomycetota bacterium]